MSRSCLPPDPDRASTAPTGTDERRTSITAAWDREWERRVADPASRLRLLRWRQRDPLLAPYSSLDELLAATGRGLPLEQADAVLAAVVRRAADDELAAHVVVRRLLPGLLKIALRRAARAGGRPPAVFADLTAASWVNVRTYPLERRPTKVAVNLLRDAEYHVFVQPYRLRRAQERPLDLDRLPLGCADLHGRDADGGPSAGDELRTLLDDGLAAGVDAADLQLLRWLYLEARSVSEVAAELAVTPRTVLSRRLAAADRLRRAAA